MLGAGDLATFLIWRLPDAVRRATSGPGSRARGEDACTSSIQGRHCREGREGSGMGHGGKAEQAGGPGCTELHPDPEEALRPRRAG